MSPRLEEVVLPRLSRLEEAAQAELRRLSYPDDVAALEVLFYEQRPAAVTLAAKRKASRAFTLFQALINSDLARDAINNGDFERALDYATEMVMLAFLSDAAIGAKIRAGAAAAGKGSERQDIHALWLERDHELASEKPKLNQTARAQQIAREFDAKGTTVRRVLTRKKLSS